MTIEADQAEVLSGLRRSETLGGPIALLIRNKDWENWQATMPIGPEPAGGGRGSERPILTRPRPGHADYAGALKYDREDIRDVLERASARETAARVAVGSIARQLLKHFAVEVASHVIAIGPAALPDPLGITFDQIVSMPPDAPLRCADPDVQAAMVDAIAGARSAGDTLGGAFEVVARNAPIGLGTCVQWDRRLDGRLAQAVMSIPGIKEVGIGRGASVATLPGSQAHDELLPPVRGQTLPGTTGPRRPTNNAGGLEGGMSNGEDIRVTAYMKPIPTLMKPLRSIDLTTLNEASATVERSDVCSVPAAGVVGEAMVCLVLADAFLEKFGGDSLAETERNFQGYVARLGARLAR